MYEHSEKYNSYNDRICLSPKKPIGQSLGLFSEIYFTIAYLQFSLVEVNFETIC